MKLSRFHSKTLSVPGPPCSCPPASSPSAWAQSSKSPAGTCSAARSTMTWCGEESNLSLRSFSKLTFCKAYILQSLHFGLQFIYYQSFQKLLKVAKASLPVYSACRSCLLWGSSAGWTKLTGYVAHPILRYLWQASWWSYDHLWFLWPRFNRMVNSSNVPAARLLSCSEDRILFNITKNWWNWPLNDGQMDQILIDQIWPPDGSIISHA